MLFLWRKAAKRDRERKEREMAAQAQIYARPPVINPAAHEHLAFAEWRAHHIKRWLDDPDNASAPLEKRNYLEAERDMYLLILRRHGKDV